MRRNRMYLVLALVAAVVALRAAPVAAQAGPDETAKFLKTVEGTVKAVGESRAQLQKTVATYNSITEMAPRTSRAPTRTSTRTSRRARRRWSTAARRSTR